MQLSDFGKAGEKAAYREALFNADELAARLKATGLVVEESEINHGDFEEWLGEIEAVQQTLFSGKFCRKDRFTNERNGYEGPAIYEIE